MRLRNEWPKPRYKFRLRVNKPWDSIVKRKENNTLVLTSSEEEACRDGSAQRWQLPLNNTWLRSGLDRADPVQMIYPSGCWSTEYLDVGQCRIQAADWGADTVGAVTHQLLLEVVGITAVGVLSAPALLLSSLHSGDVPHEERGLFGARCCMWRWCWMCRWCWCPGRMVGCRRDE